MGHRQSARTAQQSADRNGEYAHGDARVATGKVRAAGSRRIALPEREPTEATASDARGKEFVGRSDRARDCGMDWQVTMRSTVPRCKHGWYQGIALAMPKARRARTQPRRGDRA